MGFDGSTTIEEFLSTLNQEIGCRESSSSGFTLFSDDPIEKDLEHYIEPSAKVCSLYLCTFIILILFNGTTKHCRTHADRNVLIDLMSTPPVVGGLFYKHLLYECILWFLLKSMSFKK